MNLFGRLARGATRANETVPSSMAAWHQAFRPGAQFQWNGRTHQAWEMGPTNAGAIEGNSVVFAVESRRVNVFSEARFCYQQVRNGRPGDLFGTAALRMLETPWPGATTRDLLAVAELDVAGSGNSYWIEDPDYPGEHVIRLDASKVKVLTEAVEDPVSGLRVGERLIGYAHIEGRDRVTIYDPSEVAHYKPIPAPGQQFVGMSWLNPCLPDIEADGKMTQHRSSSLSNRGQLGYVVSLDPTVGPDEFNEFVALFREQHEGPANSGKTVFLGGGADVKTVGQTFTDLALKAEQGATETRIAACAGVHPVVAGLSEGMQGSSLNAGNYDSAKRSFGDITMRPAWRAFADAFASLLPDLPGARLTYDDRDIAFLRQDVTAQAEVLLKDITAARAAVDGGWNADAVIEAVRAGDIGRLLGQHSGLYSVQLQAPGTGGDQPAISDDQRAAARAVIGLRRPRAIEGHVIEHPERATT